MASLYKASMKSERTLFFVRTVREHIYGSFDYKCDMEKLVFFLGTKKCFKLRNLPSRSSTLFPSRRSARPFLNCDQRTKSATFFKEFSGKLTFYTLYSRKVRY